MDRLEEQMQQMKKAYEAIQAPEFGKQEMIFKMKQTENRQKRRSTFLRWTGGVAAALALMFALPNTSAGMAQALGDLPVVGGLFRVVTIRDYEYESERNNANVEIPHIEAEDGSSEAADQVNKSVEEYANQFITEFQEGLERFGEEGYSSLDVGYSVVYEDESWLTLKVWAVQAAGSGYEQAKFYNIDKAADKVMNLSDLFQGDSDYITVLSDNIKAQMKAQMEADENVSYFLDSDVPDWDFKEVKPDQNFYLNETGDLVICFDEYEVAPGYMGPVEFTIQRDVFENLLK